MTKTKNKILLIAILMVVAISTIGLGILLTGHKDKADATATYNQYGVSVTEGASVRTTVDSVGIRFFGNYSSEALTSNGLATINNGKLTINEGVRLGMIIAPEKALDLTNDRVLAVLENHQTANGQANYYTLLNAAFGMSTTSYAVDFTADNITVNNDNSITGRAAIVNIRDGNLKHAYKGITYYYTEATGYVYSDELEDGYQIGEIVDNFFRLGYEVDEDAIPGLRQIVAKTYAMEAVGTTEGLVIEQDGSITTTAKVGEGVELKIGQAFDGSQLANEGDTIEYTSYSANVSYNESNKTVTANGEGNVEITVKTPYGVNLVYTVENERMLNIVTNGITEYKMFSTILKGTAYKSTTYDSYYGYTLANVGNGDKKAILNVELLNTVGWKIPLCSMPNEYSPEDKYIVIGYNAYCELAGVENYVNPDNDSSYKIIAKDNSIFILGHENSLRFGVYGLLNLLIGYEKYSGKGTGISAEISFNNVDTVSLGLSQVDVHFVPEIEYNVGFNQGNVYSSSYHSTLFSNASMGYAFGHDLSNGDSYNDPGVEDSTLYKITSGHNTLGYYPIARYYDLYPEIYIKDIDGNVVENPSQICYYGARTAYNGVGLDIAMNLALSKAEAGWNFLEISNMDNATNCLCEHCNNDWAYQYFMFLNAFAERLAANETTQHIKLGGMIYKWNTTTPPLDAQGNPRITLRENVSIKFAFDYADYYAGFSDIDRALLEKWNKVCDSFKFWTYCFKPSYSMFFFDDFTNKQRFYETLVQYGATAVMDEGDKGQPIGTNFSNLRTYLGSKLSQNSGINLSDEDAAAYYEELTSAFFNQYFGPASTYLRAVFEKQKERQQYMYNNWAIDGGIYEKAYIDTGYHATLNGAWANGITPTNEIGNNRFGTYSSWTFHYSASNNNYGSRLAFTYGYSKDDFKGMLNNLYAGIDAINNDSTLSVARKTELVSRVELEMVGVIYQFMFIYEDEFAVGNKSYSSHLDASDLEALRVKTVEEGMRLFVNLCNKFDFDSINYASLRSLVTLWGIQDGVLEDTEEWN